MRIGILQTGHVADALIPEHGDYDAIFKEFLAGQGLDFSVYSVVDGVLPGYPDEADGWLITGSKHGAYEELPWIAPLEDFIRAAHADRVPMVGICFGHQIIAQALGGRVQKHPDGWSVGPTRYTIEGWGDVTLNAWHQDQVVEPPPDARTLSETAFCRYAALAYGDHVLTLQPHPEIRRAYMQGLIDVRGPGVVPAPLLREAQAAMDSPLDETLASAKIVTFLKSAATWRRAEADRRRAQATEAPVG